MLDLVTALMVALLASVPRVPQPQRDRIAHTRADLALVAADAVDETDAPPAVLLVVGFLESHWGVDAGEGGAWGAPVDRFHRHTAGTVAHAARALARSFEVCRTWVGAVARFRSGLCAPWQPAHRAYVRQAAALVERVSVRAGVPLPENWRAPANAGSVRGTVAPLPPQPADR